MNQKNITKQQTVITVYCNKPIAIILLQQRKHFNGTKQYDEAISSFDQGLQLTPNFPYIWFCRGTTYHNYFIQVRKKYIEMKEDYSRNCGSSNSQNKIQKWKKYTIKVLRVAIKQFRQLHSLRNYMIKKFNSQSQITNIQMQYIL